MDAQPEQGYTLVVSGYQFQVKPVEVSPGLLPLEAGEVPAELLGIHRQPHPGGLSLHVPAVYPAPGPQPDRARRIPQPGGRSRFADYSHIQSRTSPHRRALFREESREYTLPVGSAGRDVPLVRRGQRHGRRARDSGADNLLPLPQRLDPNAPITVDVQVASPSNHTRRVRIAAPVVSAPVMLAEWNLQADTGQRLIYRGGSLTPALGAWDALGFALLARMFTRGDRGQTWPQLIAAAVLIVLGLLIIRSTVRSGAFRGSPRHVTGAILGTVALVLGLAALASLFGLAQGHRIAPLRDLAFVAPVQSANQALTVEVATVEAKPSFARAVGYAWPAVLALAVWCCGALLFPEWHRTVGWVLGWGFLAWAALRWPNGVPGLLVILICFVLLHVAVPALRRLARVPRAPAPEPAPATANRVSPSPSLSAFWRVSCGCRGAVWLRRDQAATAQQARLAALSEPLTPQAGTLPESVQHQVRIEEAFVLGTVKIRWRANRGETLPLLSGAAVLTETEFPTNLVKLFTRPSDSGGGQWLVALTNGMAEITARYQIAVAKGPNGSGFLVPSPFGLVNQVDLVLAVDVDVYSTAAVSVQRDFNGQKTQPPQWCSRRSPTRGLVGNRAVAT